MGKPCQRVCFEVAMSSVQFKAQFSGWGCVPILGFVWSEAFQIWSLQGIGWCWFLVPKCEPPGDLTLITIPWGFCYQCPCPHSEWPSTFTWPEDPLWLLCRCSSGSHGGSVLYWLPMHTRYCVHPPEWSLCFPQFCGALALRSWLPSRPNALRVILPDARPSDCLGAPFYVIMSLCNLCGFYVLWSNSWFQYRCLPPLSSVMFTIICFIGGVTDVVVTRASRDSLLPCRCHCSVRVGVCFPVNGVEAPKSVS